jgi:hypothetical protein
LGMPRFTQGVWVPMRLGNWPRRSGPTNVLEGSTARWGCTQPRDGDQPAGRNASERPLGPVSVDPARIAARAGKGVAEPLVVGRRLRSAVDQSGVRSRRGSRGEGGSRQGQNRGVTLEIPLSPLLYVMVTKAIRVTPEVSREAWTGSRRGSYERGRGVMSPEQRVPAFTRLAPGGSTA